MPNQRRDDLSIELMKHYPKCVMLFEKPSHNSAQDAKTYAENLEKNNLKSNRLLIGMHSFLHANNHQLLDLVEKHKDEIEAIECALNYPKNPHDPSAARTYDKSHGGVMLDLGIYVFE